MWNTIFGTLAGLGLSALLARQFLRALRKTKAAPQNFFASAAGLLDNARIGSGPSLGSHRLTGRYREFGVQVQTVTDTLSVRKLPSLWLMVTIAEPLPVAATLDLMMRPGAATTFSNFDHLPEILETPSGFPLHAVLRSDVATGPFPPERLLPHLEPFFGPRAKELLITPKGLRMVVLMAEAERARYGVFRQAEFGEVSLDAALLQDILDRLLALRSAILDWSAATI